MEITITVEELRKRKLFLATPMYGGQCAGMYTKATCELTAECAKLGIELNTYFLFNESLITRARNYCVDVFLRSNSTHMLFVDSDIGYKAQDVIGMLSMVSDESEYDIIGGVYPKKNISWEKVLQAANKGKGDEDPYHLAEYAADFVFNPKPGPDGRPAPIPLFEPSEIAELGTGFMMIKRSAIEKYRDAYPEIMYTPDHARSNDFDGTRKIGMYFQAEIDKETDRYLSEDYYFCRKASAAGLKIWMCPWIRLDHVGSYIFGGSMVSLAQIGANPTVDVTKLKKEKKD